MHKYELIIYWSNGDQVFVAEVPELPGCMAHGDTKAEALANADEAIQEFLNAIAWTIEEVKAAHQGQVTTSLSQSAQP